MTIIALTLRSKTISEQSFRINEVRNVINNLPIRLSDGFVVDADAQSIANMQIIVSAWRLDDSLYTNGINWKGSDNTFRTYTKQGFTRLVNEVITKSASRRKSVFDVGEQWKRALPLPDTHEIFDPTKWSY